MEQHFQRVVTGLGKGKGKGRGTLSENNHAEIVARNEHTLDGRNFCHLLDALFLVCLSLPSLQVPLIVASVQPFAFFSPLA